MRRFRLAHLSDLHLGPVPRPTLAELASKRVFGYINWRRNRGRALNERALAALLADLSAQHCDHICVTGDLVNIALAPEFETAGRLLAKLGPPDAVSVVPGNHDAYVPGALQRATLAWAPYMTGDDGKTQLPYVRRRRDVALIGVSSAVATPPLSARGRIGKSQLNRLAAVLDRIDDAFKVVLVHHPPLKEMAPARRRLADADDLEQVLAEGAVDLVLHGHNHLASLTFLETARGHAAIVGVPSASSDGSKHPVGGYALIDIDVEARTATLHRRTWCRADNSVIADPPALLAPGNTEMV